MPLKCRLLVILLFTSFPLNVGRAEAQRTAGEAGDAAIPVPGVEVVIVNKSAPGSKPLKVKTDADGKFRFPTLAPGTYAVTVQLPAGGEVRDRGITINTSHVERLTVSFKGGAAFNPREYGWDVRRKEAIEKPKDGADASRSKASPEIVVTVGAGDPQPTEGAINTTRSNIKNTSDIRRVIGRRLKLSV
jgi:hypothetical protein